MPAVGSQHLHAPPQPNKLYHLAVSQSTHLSVSCTLGTPCSVCLAPSSPGGPHGPFPAQLMSPELQTEPGRAMEGSGHKPPRRSLALPLDVGSSLGGRQGQR